MSASKYIVIVAIFVTVLAALAVIARLVSRLVVLKNGGRDDVAISLSLLFSIGLLASTIYQIRWGLGRHFETLSTDDFEHILLGLWISILNYNVSLTLTKFSIVMQYMRVFPSSLMRCACLAALTLTGAYGLHTLFTGIFTCVPVSIFWMEGARGKCINKTFLWLFNAGFNIFTDLIVLGLPMPMLSSIKLPLKQKIGLIFVFALVGFVNIVSILRLHSLLITSRSTDITYDNVSTAIWSMIEVDVEIICASLPTLKPVVSACFPRLLSSNRSKPVTITGPLLQSNRNLPVPSPSPRPMDIDSICMTITRVQATEGRIADVEIGACGRGEEHVPKKIFIKTEMTQAIERQRGSDSGSSNLIQAIQRRER